MNLNHDGQVRPDDGAPETPSDFSKSHDSFHSAHINASTPYGQLDNHQVKNSVPQVIVHNEPSPDGWEPQVIEKDPQTSLHVLPESSTEFSLESSFVTAPEKTPAPMSRDKKRISFRNFDESTRSATSSEEETCSTEASPSMNGTPNETLTSTDASGSLGVSSSSISTDATGSSREIVSPSSMSTSPDVVSSNIKVPSIEITSSDMSSFSGDQSTNSMISIQKDSTEAFGDSDEEYFEEYHLPNTHENAFVRHLSFRRKVQTTPIHAPDAERIEGLVRTGEFVRHGSIRKKILPEEEEHEYYDEIHEDEDLESFGLTKSIENEFHIIDGYLKEDEAEKSLPSYSDATKDKTPVNSNNVKRATSTPKAPNEADYDDAQVAETIIKGKENSPDEAFDESSSIEDSTLRKIQECLDFSSYKDLLNLSGRLSDLLSPKEVEDVLINSERYRQYLDSEVFEALSLSFQGQTQSLPCNINCSSTNERKSNASDDSSAELKKNIVSPDLELPDSENLHWVRRSSAACNGIGAQGIFVETLGSTSDLRKISAPKVNLDWSAETNLDFVDSSEDFEDSTRSAIEDYETAKKRISFNRDILNISEDISNDTEADQETEAIRNVGEEEITPSPIITDSPPSLIQSHPLPPPPDLIPELTPAEEYSEIRHWRNVVIGGAWRRIDMKVIAPYCKCIIHGGYTEDSQSPIVVLSAALLPEKSRKDYNYIMDNLFMYVLSFVEQLAADDYVLVYFSGGVQNGSGPGFHWMRRAYEMIDRRLRKNLKSLLLVHPSLWARTILTLSRPFISSKFYRKLVFVPSLTKLSELIPLEQIDIPDVVKQADFQIMIKERKKVKR